MKIKLFIFFAFTFLSVNILAQGSLKTFSICNSADSVKKVNQGDTVIIACANAYLLNQNVLTNYQKSLQNNANCNTIIKTYAALSNEQDSMIAQQNQRFNELKSKFDSLGNNTGQFLTLTQANLTQLNDTLGAVSSSIMQTKQLLSETKSLLEQEQSKNWMDRLKWGIGGFTVGLVATTIVYLVVK